VTSPVLDAVLLSQLAKLNPGIVNAARAQDIVRRLVRVRPSIERNLDAWEFFKGLKTVFVDTEKRERGVAASGSGGPVPVAAPPPDDRPGPPAGVYRRPTGEPRFAGSVAAR
jgi:hypothetical protein